MKSLLKIAFIALFMICQTNVFAQIIAPNASGSFATDYSTSFINNGGENDLVYVFCADSDETDAGELQVSNVGCSVVWYEFDGVSYQPMGVTGSIATNLSSGGYMAQVNCGGTIVCYRAWVWVNRAHVDIAPIDAGCEEFTLDGSVDELDNSFAIQDPPGVNFEVDENTNITVCFWADHPYLSDLGFYLKSPGHEMDDPAFPILNDGAHEVVELLPSVADWGPGGLQGSWTGLPFTVLGCSNPGDEGVPCQDGNNVVNFCFTSTLEASNPAFTACICDMTPPATGFYASAGPW
ncbi:MAG: hypothetical protein MI749_22285, partial [Desulfovibrionales bacterium]|nr:hypothetical protein [Desulfovibrionales bacterium]